MKNKIPIGTLISLFVLISGYFIFTELRYNNIVKIETNIVINAVLTDKKDIKEFMKHVNNKNIIGNPVSILPIDTGVIDDNVVLHYKNGTTNSFFITIDIINAELSYLPHSDSSKSYKINKNSTEKILEILNRNSA